MMAPATESRPSDAGRGGWIAAALAVAVVALVLRFWRLGGEGLWCDEAYMAHLMHLPLGQMLSELITKDDAPPLFYLLGRVVTALLGDGEGVLRLVPALAGLATVALLLAAALARRSRAHLWAAAFTAISAYAVFYARQARSYALVMFLTLGVMLATQALLLGGRRRAGPWLAGVGVLLCCTHHLGILVVATSLVLWPLRGARGVPLRPYLVWHAVPIAAWLLLWAASASQLHAHQVLNTWMGAYWQAHSLWLAPLLSLVAFVPGALPPGWAAVAFPTAPGMAWLWPALAGLAASGALAAAFLSHRGALAGPPPHPAEPAAPAAEPAHPDDRRAALIEAGFLVLPLAALLVASLLLSPVYVLGRTDGLAFPAFALLLGRGMARWPRGAALPALGLWCALSLAALAPTYGWGDRTRAKGADRELAAFLAAEGLAPGDWVVHGFLTAPSVEYYLRRQGIAHRTAWFPEAAGRTIAGAQSTPIDSLDAYLEEARALRARMEAGMTEHDSAWVLALLGPESPEPWLRAARPAIGATDLGYPGSVLVYALVGAGQVPVRRVYRQDWVGGTRLLLQIPRSLWVPADSLPPVIAPGGQAATVTP